MCVHDGKSHAVHRKQCFIAPALNNLSISFCSDVPRVMEEAKIDVIFRAESSLILSTQRPTVSLCTIHSLLKVVSLIHYLSSIISQYKLKCLGGGGLQCPFSKISVVCALLGSVTFAPLAC